MIVKDSFSDTECPYCFHPGAPGKEHRVCPECGVAFYIPSRIEYRQNRYSSRRDQVEPEETH